MQSERFYWSTGHSVLAYQIPLLIALPFYWIYGPAPSLTLIFISIGLFVFSQMSITAGYHRLFSHRTYKVVAPIKWLLLFFGGMAAQNSAIRWAFGHRCHHSFEDTENDPYSIKRGFWFAHFGWLFEKPCEIDKKVVADLFRDPVIAFQHKYEVSCMILPNIFITLLVAWIVQDFIGAAVLSFGVRLFCTHHSTFLINSLAHTHGSRPYDKLLSAVNQPLVTIPTMGEGCHHFHHAFPNDYRTGFRWFHYDPAKWLIWTWTKLGLAGDLRRTSAEQIQRRQLRSKSDKEEQSTINS